MSHLFASEKVDASELQQLLVLLKDAGVRASVAAIVRSPFVRDGEAGTCGGGLREMRGPIL